MLCIYFNGIKPNDYNFEYSVIDNNEVDFIDFSFNTYHEGTPFVKIESKDKSYIDKINASEYVNQRHIIFPLLAKTTANKAIRIQISFETEETKWQTECVEVILKNSIRADEEIENKYPNALIELEQKVKNLYPKNEHNFITYTSKYGFDLPSDCHIFLTQNVKKQSKLVCASYIGKKQGNKDIQLTITTGIHSVEDIVSSIFGTVSQTLRASLAEEQINAELSGHFAGRWIIKDHNRKFFIVAKDDLYQNISIGKLSNALIGFEGDSKKNCVFKMQFKFVKDFQSGGENRAWKGTMASVYLDCLVYAFKHSPNIYISPIVRRF